MKEGLGRHAEGRTRGTAPWRGRGARPVIIMGGLGGSSIQAHVRVDGASPHVAPRAPGAVLLHCNVILAESIRRSADRLIFSFICALHRHYLTTSSKFTYRAILDGETRLAGGVAAEAADRRRRPTADGGSRCFIRKSYQTGRTRPRPLAPATRRSLRAWVGKRLILVSCLGGCTPACSPTALPRRPNRPKSATSRRATCHAHPSLL